jgi:hypothetical protein
VPFVAAGVGFARLAVVFQWVKRHFRLINVTSGLLLAAFGVLLLSGRLGQFSNAIQRGLDAVGLHVLTRI